MNQIEAAAATFGDKNLPRSLRRTGFSDFGGSALLLRAYQAAPMLIAGAPRVGHGVAVAGLAQMGCKSGGEVTMPAAPS